MNLDQFWNRYGTRNLFHFTDSRNLPSIRSHGGLFSLAELHSRSISVEAPAGNDWSHQADERFGVNKYVHLCFCKSHPMHYVAKKEGRIADSTFLEISHKILEVDGVRWTSGVANKSGMQILTWGEATAALDFEVLYDRLDWNIPEIRARRQAAEKYEVLVPTWVPLHFISGV